MENQTTTPEHEPFNKIGKVQVTRVWLTPDLETALYEFDENFKFFSNVSLSRRADGSHTFAVNTSVCTTANRALLHWFIAFAETQLRKQKQTK